MRRFSALIAVIGTFALLTLPARGQNEREFQRGYRSFQNAAPEFLQIEVISVDTAVSKGLGGGSRTRVEASARVIDVIRSDSGVAQGESITIRYDHAPKAGNSAETPQILESGKTYPAFLERKGSIFVPVARHLSFIPPSGIQMKVYEEARIRSREKALAAQNPPNAEPKPVRPSPVLMPESAVTTKPSSVVEFQPEQPPLVLTPPAATALVPDAPALNETVSPAVVMTAPAEENSEPLIVVVSPPERSAEEMTLPASTPILTPSTNPTVELIPTADVPRVVPLKPQTAPEPAKQAVVIPAATPTESTKSVVTPPPPAPVVAPVPEPAMPVVESLPVIESLPVQQPAPSVVATKAPAPSTPAIVPPPVRKEEPVEPVVIQPAQVSTPPTTTPEITPSPAAAEPNPKDSVAREGYAEIYGLIKEGESFQLQGDNAKATATYQQAREKLLKLRAEQPGFQPFMVEYRLRDLEIKLQSLNAPASTTPEAPKPK